jgi:hypothetical protein
MYDFGFREYAASNRGFAPTRHTLRDLYRSFQAPQKTLNMESAMFVETEKLQHSMRCILTAFPGGLFNDAFIMDITASNDELENIWKEAAVTYLKLYPNNYQEELKNTMEAKFCPNSLNRENQQNQLFR